MKRKYFLLYILSFFSKYYKQKYYTILYCKLIPNCAQSAVFKGKIQISDYMQIHIGANCIIDKNLKLNSEGGIYLADNSEVKKNNNYFSSDVKTMAHPSYSKQAQLLKPIFVENNNKKNNNTYNNDFLVASTGRSGSNTIADLLNKHPEISCTHEQYGSLTRLSTQYAHYYKNDEETIKELEFIFKKCTTQNSSKKIKGDSDQKYSNLIQLLYHINPKFKFIWLIRRADEFVASAFARRWFDDAEYAFPEHRHSPDTNSDFGFLNKYRVFYSIYRLNGNACGAFTAEEWNNMTCFERCCWYWYYWNQLIEKQFEHISASNKYFIKLEELNNDYKNIFKFLGVEPIDVNIEIKNKAQYTPYKSLNWNKQQIDAYNKWCAPGMKKWYGE